jgi:hypothetical protein
MVLLDGSECTRHLHGSKLRVVAHIEPEGLGLPSAEELDGLWTAPVGGPQIGGAARPE